ncbi:hypothetical protein [Serratia sarumanii]|uniref:hypothetical protein n=1 Tax=Serratia sarumanii TaxID=3020826 RepID=UPI003F7E7CCE
MTTIKRFTPDYKMHAVRFEAFAREAEHGEYVKFDAHQRAVSALEAERDALAVENAALKSRSIKLFNLGYLHGHESTVEGYFVDVHRNDIDTYHDDVVAEIIEDEDKTPATDAALAVIRDKYRAEGINFTANRLLAAFEHGFIDNPAGEVADVAKMILSAVTELPGAPEEDFTRDYSDEVIALIRAELREAK